MIMPCFILKDRVDLCGQYILDIINSGITCNSFPNDMKKADFTPVFKDSDRTLKFKYRSISLLLIVSTIFERTLEEQVSDFMENILKHILCGKGYSTQYALVLLIEKLRKAIDNKCFAGALLMDLSKAFDTLDHELLIAKLHAYGFNKNALSLIHSYLKNRWQRVKINNSFSSWFELLTGVPQGSILGPLLFIIYLNDIFYFITDTDVCNYADDTTLYTWDNELNKLIKRLEKETRHVVDWFNCNFMKLNGDKCHLLTGERKNKKLMC